MRGGLKGEALEEALHVASEVSRVRPGIRGGIGGGRDQANLVSNKFARHEAFIWGGGGVGHKENISADIISVPGFHGVRIHKET